MLGNDKKWFKVSIRFCGGDLNLSAVTSALSLEPDSTGRRGEHIDGNPRYAVYDTNIWVHSYAETLREPFSDRLSEFVTRLEGRAEELRALLARPGVTAELFAGFSSGNGQGGFTIPAALLARIADLGLDFSLDLYPPSVDEA